VSIRATLPIYAVTKNPAASKPRAKFTDSMPSDRARSLIDNRNAQCGYIRDSQLERACERRVFPCGISCILRSTLLSFLLDFLAPAKSCPSYVDYSSFVCYVNGGNRWFTVLLLFLIVSYSGSRMRPRPRRARSFRLQLPIASFPISVALLTISDGSFQGKRSCRPVDFPQDASSLDVTVYFATTI